MGFEPLETIRALRKCSERSLVISSTSPIVPFTVASGRARYPEVADMMGTVARRVARLIAFDARASLVTPARSWRSTRSFSARSCATVISLWKGCGGESDSVADQGVGLGRKPQGLRTGV